MKITIEQMEKLGACAEGIEWLKNQKDCELSALVKESIKQGIETMRFANWGLVRVMTDKQKRQYAIFAASSVLPIFEKRFPEDKRPRAAVEAAEAYLIDPSEDNREKAEAAAAAARAAEAAEAAAAAARAAEAAWAAEAAEAAAEAAWAAAWAAAEAAEVAAEVRTLAKILRYGVKLVYGAKD